MEHQESNRMNEGEWARHGPHSPIFPWERYCAITSYKADEGAAHTSNDSLDKKDVLEKRQYTDQDQPVHA